jgi:hypothetical protein
LTNCEKFAGKVNDFDAENINLLPRKKNSGRAFTRLAAVLTLKVPKNLPANRAKHGTDDVRAG